MSRTRPEKFPSDDFDPASREDKAFECLAANLPETDIVVYEPIVFNWRGQSRKPDFVLFSPHYGCVVMEVKNWDLDGIVGLSPEKNMIKFYDETRTAPFHQAQGHSYALKDYLRRRKGRTPEGIIHRKGPHKGQLSFCVTPAVVFMGAKDVELPGLAEKLGMDARYLFSEESLGNPETLRTRLQALPKAFEGKVDMETMLKAADMLLPASETEKTIAEVLRELDKARNRLGSEAASELETFRMHRETLADVTDELARLIAGQSEEDPAVQELAELAKKLSDHCFLVGAFGTSAAGKSTLVNALVDADEDLFPEGMGRTTLVVNRVEKSDDERPHGSFVFKYKTEEEVAKQIENLLKDFDLDPEGIPEDRQLEDQGFREWLNDQVAKVTSFKEGDEGEAPTMSAREAANSLGHFLDGWDECREFLADERCFAKEQSQEGLDLIHKPNEKHACYVAERILYHDNRLTSEHDIQLIDSPGVSADASDTLRAVNIARKSDAFVMVTSVDFQFMQADRDFLEELHDSLEGSRKRKLIFVLNKIQSLDPDRCTPPVDTEKEATAQQEERLLEKLGEYGFSRKDVHILPVDARCAKYARRINKIPKKNVSDDLKKRFERVRFPGCESLEENLQLSGIEKFEADLVEILLDLKYKDADEQVFRIEKSVADYKNNLRNAIDDFKRSIEDIEKELSEHGNRRKQLKRHMSGFHDEIIEIIKYEIETECEEGCGKLLTDFMKEIEKSVLAYCERRREDDYTPKIREIIAEVLNECTPYLINGVQGFRKQQEARYNHLKTQAISEEIPEIIKGYGEDIEWVVQMKDLEEAERCDLLKSLSCLELGLWQKIKAILEGFFVNIFSRKTSSEQARGIILKYIEENKEAFQKEASTRILRWIKDDREEFERQITEHLEQVMKKIGDRIRHRVADKKKWQVEEQSRQVVLNRFHDVSEEIIGKLGEIRKVIEARERK